jgi:hypothetical protein
MEVEVGKEQVSFREKERGAKGDATNEKMSLMKPVGTG